MVEGKTYGVLLKKRTKRRNKHLVFKKKRIFWGNILAVVLLTALFAVIYCVGNVRI